MYEQCLTFIQRQYLTFLGNLGEKLTAVFTARLPISPPSLSSKFQTFEYLTAMLLVPVTPVYTTSVLPAMVHTAPTVLRAEELVESRTPTDLHNDLRGIMRKQTPDNLNGRFDFRSLAIWTRSRKKQSERPKQNKYRSALCQGGESYHRLIVSVRVGEYVGTRLIYSAGCRPPPSSWGPLFGNNFVLGHHRRAQDEG